MKTKPLSLNRKLQLTSRKGMLTLFDEGVFVRAYNESVYLLSQVMGKPLNSLVYKMKYKPFYTVITASVPKTQLNNSDGYLSGYVIEKTDFGFEINGNFELIEYSTWFKQTALNCE